MNYNSIIHAYQMRFIDLWFALYFPAGIYLLKVNNKIIRATYEICSKLMLVSVFIVNFEHI